VINWTPNEAQGPGTATFTTIVTDNGTPALGATNTFTVTVNEVNGAPVLPNQVDRTINELTTLTVTNSATDPDLPDNALTYQLVSPPAGASISASGVISWTPNEAQGPGTATFTTIVMDNGTPALRATNNFTVTVSEVNSAPVLTVPPEQTINELSALVLTNTASDADLPANSLTYALVSGPSGVAVDPTTGVLTWTPTEDQGPSTNTITVKVTDDGEPSLSHTNAFKVIVNEVNSAPLLTMPPEQRINELNALVVTNTASDADLPANTLSYELVSGPAGVAVDPTTGVLTWIPTEDQGPSTNAVTVKVTDDGEPALSHTNSFNVIVGEVNSAPILMVPPNQTIDELSKLVLTNTAVDVDIPTNTLIFSLDPGSPAGAEIDPTTGVFTWTPTPNQVRSTNIVTVRVTDDGVPSLSDVKAFTIVVVAPPLIEAIVASWDTVTITWSAMPGAVYRVQFKSDQNESTWTDLPGDITATGSTATKTDVLDRDTQRYYRVLILP
jgi:hypothetical protein